MDVIDLLLEQIIPYTRNPRQREGRGHCGRIHRRVWLATAVVMDEQRVVLAGHTRLEAARRRGWTLYRCISPRA